MTKISASEILFVCGDFNGQTGFNDDKAEWYKGVHDGRVFGRCNTERARICCRQEPSCF